MESVDIQDWEVIESYTRKGNEVRLYEGTDTEAEMKVYRYEVEDKHGNIEEPGEPFPFDELEECRDAANDEADTMAENQEQDKLEEIARLIREGYTSGVEPSWTLETSDVDKNCLKYFGESDQNHIADKVTEGTTSGEIVTFNPKKEKELRGWWTITIN